MTPVKYIFKTLLLVSPCLLIMLGAAHGQFVGGYSIICSTDHDQILPYVVSDGAEGGIVAWMDERNGSYDIYAQRVDPKGYTLWTENGVPICSASGEQRWRENTSFTFYQYIPRIISDDAGGAIMVWEDDRGGSDTNIYIQRIDGNGNTLWEEDGTPVVTSSYWQEYPCIASNGASGAIVSWKDSRDYSYWRIYAQNFDANGIAQWPDNGIRVITTDIAQHYSTITADGLGGAVITWQQHTGEYWNIHAQRLDPDGNRLWGDGGVAVCVDTTNQERPFVVEDGADCFVVAWIDHRSGSSAVYAQRLDQDGNTLWADNGVLICGAGFATPHPCLVSGGAGNTIIAWKGDGLISDRVYTQMIDQNGNATWGTSCFFIAANGPEATVQYDQAMVTDGEGGAIIVMNWHFDQIFAQRMSDTGTRLWTSEGAPIWGAYGGTRGPAALAHIESGGAIVVWQDFREHSGSLYYNDIVAARVDLEGNKVANLLSTFSHNTGKDGITIEWTTTRNMNPKEMSIFRRTINEEDFSEIQSAVITGNGLRFVFTDSDCEPGIQYVYMVSVRDDGKYIKLFETDPILVPALALMLKQNYPNPFNPSTTIAYYLPSAGRVVIEIFDVSGRRVRTIEDSNTETGHHSAGWNGRDNHGDLVGSGIYFCRLSFKKECLTRKIILTR
jgi:hypothetical protein